MLFKQIKYSGKAKTVFSLFRIEILPLFYIYLMPACNGDGNSQVVYGGFSVGT